MIALDETTRQRAEQILGYQFLQPHLLAEALTHASVADHRLRSNERMEFFGDAILGAVVCEDLYHRYPDDLEGELTKIKSAVVSRRACAEVSEKLGLTALLSLGKGMSNRGQLPASLGAAVVESLVAALYLDGGLEPARRFILDHFTALIESAAESAHQHNFKSVLQQHAQRFLDDLPTYRILDEKGPDHSKCFEVCAEIGGQQFEAAWGQSKKQAEQQAALLALAQMGVAVIDDEGQVHISEEDEREMDEAQDDG